MLYWAHFLKDISFRQLMEVYQESNQENGKEQFPQESSQMQILLSEERFYTYLQESFFRTKGAVYALWMEGGRYVSALRLEPYHAGLLLEALETHPEERRKGYASMLIRGVQASLPVDTVLYSHISRRNQLSMRAHLRCGFEKCLDYAAYIDGSVNTRAVTLCWKKSSEK